MWLGFQKNFQKIGFQNLSLFLEKGIQIRKFTYSHSPNPKLYLINTSSGVRTRRLFTVVDVRLAECARPAGLTNALPIEERVDTKAVHTRIRLAEVRLNIATFADKAVRAFAFEIVN